MPDNENTRKGRILALDLGKKRIGLAVSDPLGITAQGLPTLERVNLRTDIDAIDRLAGEYDARLILVGHPMHLDGRESRQSEYTREFVGKLTERTGRDVKLWDERMTSIQAERILKESGVSIAKRARAIDKLAAQILLESFLGWEANGLAR